MSIHYAKQSELAKPMKPLFTKGVYGLQLLEGKDGYFGVESPEEGTHGPGCLQGQNATTHVFSDAQGRKFTGHWVVKPGREVNQTLVTKILELPYDTTIHYIAVHLHPFAESLELRDLTAGAVVFKSSTRQFPDRIGLAHVDSFSSVEGIPIYKDHEYELVSVYQNITDQDQDSMAVMNLYMLDKDFVSQRSSRSPSPSTKAAARPRSPPSRPPPRIVDSPELPYERRGRRFGAARTVRRITAFAGDGRARSSKPARSKWTGRPMYDETGGSVLARGTVG